MEITPAAKEDIFSQFNMPHPRASTLTANPVAERGKRNRPISELRKVRAILLNQRTGFDARRIRLGAKTSQAAISKNIPKKALSLMMN